MPTVDPFDLARLREQKQWSEPYLVVHKPNAMLTGTVNDPDIEQGEQTIAFNNGGACPGYNPPLTFVKDTFTAPNGTSLDAHAPDINKFGNPWVEVQGDWNIQSNKANLVFGVATAIIDAGTSDGIVRVDATTQAGIAAVWEIVFRYSDLNNYWYWRIDANTGNANLVYRQGGSWKEVWISNIGIEIAHTYNLMVKLCGHAISCYVDDVCYIKTVNSFLNSKTKHGIEADTINSRFDNFEIFEIPLGRHTTLWTGTTPGNRDIGIVRVKGIVGSWPYNSGIIEVAENSDIQWEDGLYLTVKDEHRIWPRFPRVALSEFPDPTGTIVTWWKDYDVVYDDQNILEPPVVVMGPPAVAFLDAGSATVEFWGDDSYSPRDTTLTGTAWTFPWGTPATATTLGTEVAPHTVTWDTAGTYMTRLQITDTNGHISNGYRPVFIMNRSGAGSPYTDFEIRSMSGSFAAGGWTASFRIFAQADVTDFPEGAQVVVFAEDWYGGEKRSIGGYCHRENIVFVGWIKTDSVRKEPETGEITFDAHTTHGELQNCPSFPISVDRVTTTPANWNEIHDMDLNLAAFHVGYWHSTMYEVADVLESSDSRVIKYLDIPESNIYQQLDRTVWEETIFARTLVDRQGRVKYDCNPQYLQPYERGNLDTIMTLTNDDWLGVVDAKEVHEPQISWIDASGVRVASWEKSYPVFSMAPGVTPKPDGSFTQLTNMLVTDQHDMDRVAGYALANANKMHPDRTLGLAEVTVPLQGNYRIFDIQPQEWVLFPSLDTLRAGRGPHIDDDTPWPTGTRFIPRDVDLTFDNTLGCFLASIGLEPETIGPSGTSVVYPGQLGSGGSVAIVTETMTTADPTGLQIDRVFVSRDIFADSPTWAQRHNGLPNFPPPGGRVFKINNLEIDPFSNGYDGTPTQALIGVKSRYGQYGLIYHNADLYNDTPWVNVLGWASVLAQAYGGVGSIDDSDCNDLKYDRTTNGWAYAIIWVEHIVAAVSSYELLGFKTVNHGLTWTFVANISAQVGGAAPRDHNCGAQVLAITDPFDPNYMYAKVDLLSTGAHDWRWIRSVDKGVTWTSRMGGATTNTVYLRPAQNSDDAWYDPAGSGWSLGFFSQVGTDIGGNACSFTVRFPAAGIGQNAAGINSAHVHIKAFTGGQTGPGPVTVTITGIDESWLPTFTTRGAFNSWGTTAASVNWGLPVFVPGTDYQTPDLTAIIQELTSRANWDPTCAIGLRFRMIVAAAGNMRVAYNYEDSPTDTPRLDINYDCAALTTYPNVPAVLFPRHSRNHLASYWGLTPPTSDRTNDGWASRYYWYALGAGDGPVSMVEPLYGSYPMVYLTDPQGTDPNYISYVHTSYDGETFTKSQLLPVQIAQSFRVWPWQIEGANTLMYIANRTGDSEAPMAHYPYQFWISEDGGDAWQEKTGNLNTLMDSLGLAKDRTERIRPLEINIVF